MKLLIASDIHGSAYYAQKLTEKFKRTRAHRLILLGDILYHGPRNDLPRDYDPKAVAEVLNSVADRISAVRGNCDSEVDEMLLDFDITSRHLTFMSGERIIHATHGHNNNFKTFPDEILLCGHTHVPVREIRDDCIYVNPGSVSIPKEASPHSYLMLEDGRFRWYDLETGECYMEDRI